MPRLIAPKVPSQSALPELNIQDEQHTEGRTTDAATVTRQHPATPQLYIPPTHDFTPPPQLLPGAGDGYSDLALGNLPLEAPVVAREGHALLAPYPPDPPELWPALVQSPVVVHQSQCL